MFDFEALSQAILNQTVLCVGDLMLDEFVYGEVSRISPEAPAPVIAVQRSETNVGGAGNVARNIGSVGGRCIFAGLVGEDEAGAKLKAELARESLIEAVLVSDASRATTRKVRFVSEHFSTHMLRADWELALPASPEIEQRLIDAILPLLPRADIVLLSDYAKGVLTARVIRNIIDSARKLGKRVIVDARDAARLRDGIAVEPVSATELADQADALISLGGDGTMLRAVDLAYEAGVPVLGLNFGQMGYLTEVEPHDADHALDRILAGDYSVTERMVVAVDVESAGPAGGRWYALNETVLEKVHSGRLVRLGVDINDAYFTSYAADGVGAGAAGGRPGSGAAQVRASRRVARRTTPDQRAIGMRAAASGCEIGMVTGCS